MINFKGIVAEFFFGMPVNLRRITSHAVFIPEIDGLRFLAIMPVIIFHFGERWLRANSTPLTPASSSVSEILTHFHIGVYIFFAVSGFILALPFGASVLGKDKKVSFLKYYLRRVTRLEPPYIIIMTLLFIVLVIVKHQDFIKLLPHYGASLLYIHRLVYGIWTPINPPAWTLEIEVQFYILAPFLALGYFKIKPVPVRRIVLVTLICGKIFLYNLTTVFDPTFQTLPFSIEFFLIGILMADIFLVDWKDGVKQHWIFDWISLVSFIGLFVSWSWAKNMVMNIGFIICLFFTFYGSFRSVRVNKFLRNQWITAIGGMCYTIYLLHLAFAEFFVAVWKHCLPSFSYLSRLGLGLVLFLPSLFIISSILFRLLEKPCMDTGWPGKLQSWLNSFRKEVRNERRRALL